MKIMNILFTFLITAHFCLQQITLPPTPQSIMGHPHRQNLHGPETQSANGGLNIHKAVSTRGFLRFPALRSITRAFAGLILVCVTMSAMTYGREPMNKMLLWLESHNVWRMVCHVLFFIMMPCSEHDHMVTMSEVLIRMV